MAEITVGANLHNLKTVIEFICKQLEEADCSQKIMRHIMVASEEIFVNVASYAYQPLEGDITVWCEIEKNPPKVIIGFMDKGKPYNPLIRKDPDITLDAKDRVKGGLGIFMTKKLMDEVKYDFQNESNILSLCKNI